MIATAIHTQPTMVSPEISYLLACSFARFNSTRSCLLETAIDTAPAALIPQSSLVSEFQDNAWNSESPWVLRVPGIVPSPQFEIALRLFSRNVQLQIL